MNSQIKTLQTLLVGVDSLNNAVLGDDTVPLAAMIGDLKRITAESAFLNPILDSLPSKAVDSGVVSSGSLRTTFGGLKQLGKLESLNCLNNFSLSLSLRQSPVQ